MGQPEASVVQTTRQGHYPTSLGPSYVKVRVQTLFPPIGAPRSQIRLAAVVVPSRICLVA